MEKLKKNTHLLIKPTKRKCSSGWSCLDVYDELSGKPLIGKDCDVITIEYNGKHIAAIDVVDGKVRLSNFTGEVEIEPIINTFRYKINRKEIK